MIYRLIHEHFLAVNLRWMPLKGSIGSGNGLVLSDGKPLLPEPMLSQIYGVTSSQWVKTFSVVKYPESLTKMRPEWSDFHFTDDTFICIFLKQIFFYFDSKLISMFVPKGPVHNESALVQVMAWHQTGKKPLHEPLMTKFTDAYA